MNNVTIEVEKKTVVMKSLAILGLIFIISFIAWLSVQIVAVAPSAFSSLASLASSISDAREEVVEEMKEPEVLTIQSNTQTITTSEQVVLSWDDVDAPGTYAFVYECSNGVTVEITGVDGFRNIACGTNYNLGDIQNLTFTVASNEIRSTDIAYTISFLRSDETKPSHIGSGTVTVTNLAIADPNEPVVEAEEETPEVVVEEEAPAVTPPVVVEEPEFVFEIPVSNPNGTADLTTRFLNVGEIINNRFVAGTVERDETGAIQFEVRNIGNKTSESWSFEVSLPDGSTYESTTQAPLRPNERATLALGFEADGGSSFTFEVSVESDDERTENNNSFRQIVSFR